MRLGVKLGSSWGQAGVKLGSSWGQVGVTCDHDFVVKTFQMHMADP